MNRHTIEIKTELVLTIDLVAPSYRVDVGTVMGQLIGEVKNNIVNMNPAILEGTFLLNTLDGELIGSDKLDLGEHFAESIRQVIGGDVFGYYILAGCDRHGKVGVGFAPTLLNHDKDYGDKWALRESYKILLNETQDFLALSAERSKIEKSL